MNEEIKFLDVIRRTILTIDDISNILKISSEQQKMSLPGGKTAHIHLHDQFEMRILMENDTTNGIDTPQLREICLTPPQLLHVGLEPNNLRRHLTLRISADEMYYLRGVKKLLTFSLSDATKVPGVNYTELVTALGNPKVLEHDPEHIRILIALLLSTLRWLLTAEKNITASPAEIIAAYIRENYYRSDLSIREIAEVTKFSPNYIQKVFRAGWGGTPIEYLTEVRLNAARQLLRQHRWQIKEVAAMCGWNYAHYFCRRYKEHFGILPSEE